MKEAHPLEQFARAVEGDETALSAALQALFPESELQSVGGQINLFEAEGQVSEEHADMIADLSGWVDARNWIVGRSREDVSPIAAAFLTSLRTLSSEAVEPLIPIITWTDDGETQRIAVV